MTMGTALAGLKSNQYRFDLIDRPMPNIDIRIQCVSQLYNPLDASLHQKRKHGLDMEAYIVDCAGEYAISD